MNQQQLELQRDLYLLLLESGGNNKNIEETLLSALELVVQITGARIGYIELRNRDGSKWWSKYHCSPREVETIRHRISTGIIAEAITTGEIIITPSAFLDPRFQNRDSVQEEKIEAVLCSPFEQDGITGVIYLQGDDGSHFEDEDCMMETELFARHITPLLRQLHTRVQGDAYKGDLRNRYDLSDIIGESPALMKKLSEAMIIAELDVAVLLTGETGTGKGAFARVIHNNSVRKYKPFIHINCANLPEHLAESELFGAAKGAHSGAYTEIKGKIAAAKGGTLFLDEIGVLPISLQSKLLKFLEDGVYYPLGSTVAVESDCRIISATNLDFKEAIRQGSFREDLYYRLCVFPINLPSLRQRKEDIPALTEYFINKYCEVFKISQIPINQQVLSAFKDSEWDGNVRQLENTIQQGIVRAKVLQSTTLQLSHFLPDEDQVTNASDESVTYRQGKDSWERHFIRMHLENHDWNVSETAKALDLSRSHLNNLIKIHNLERNEFINTGG